MFLVFLLSSCCLCFPSAAEPDCSIGPAPGGVVPDDQARCAAAFGMKAKGYHDITTHVDRPGSCLATHGASVTAVKYTAVDKGEAVSGKLCCVYDSFPDGGRLYPPC